MPQSNRQSERQKARDTAKRRDGELKITSIILTSDIEIHFFAVGNTTPPSISAEACPEEFLAFP
jgi:hypothetical protein